MGSGCHLAVKCGPAISGGYTFLPGMFRSTPTAADGRAAFDRKNRVGRLTVDHKPRLPSSLSSARFPFAWDRQILFVPSIGSDNSHLRPAALARRSCSARPSLARTE